MFLEVYPQVLGISTDKRCTQCGNVKPRSAFSRKSGTADGLRQQCRDCCNNDAREYTRREHENIKARRLQRREEETAARRLRRKQTPGKCREEDRRYREAHPDRIKESRRKNYYKHVDERREKARAYRQANPDKRREYAVANRDKSRIRDHRYRARKFENGGTYTAKDLATVRAAQTDKRGRLICWRCGKPITDTPDLDHWIPLAEGGTNDAGNLHYMHATCNRSKGAKHPTEIGRLL